MQKYPDFVHCKWKVIRIWWKIVSGLIGFLFIIQSVLKFLRDLLCLGLLIESWRIQRNRMRNCYSDGVSSCPCSRVSFISVFSAFFSVRVFLGISSLCKWNALVWDGLLAKQTQLNLRNVYEALWVLGPNFRTGICQRSFLNIVQPSVIIIIFEQCGIIRSRIFQDECSSKRVIGFLVARDTGSLWQNTSREVGVKCPANSLPISIFFVSKYGNRGDG
jgi:hypothetical protein